MNLSKLGKLLACLVTLILLAFPFEFAFADKPGHGHGYGGYKHRSHHNHGYHGGHYGHHYRPHHNYSGGSPYFFGGNPYFFGGGNPYFFSPFGLSFAYVQNDYDFGPSSARFYRPGYGYYGTPRFSDLDYPGPYCSSARYHGNYFGPRLNQPFNEVERLATEQLMGDYAPVAVAPSVPESIIPSPMIGTNDAAATFQLQAETAFRQGRYDDAVGLVDQAIAVDDQNGQLYLFSSQAKFAVGNFQQAVADLSFATNKLPSEQWSYVVKNYRNIYGQNDYVSQMDLLAKEIAKNPQDYSLRTLRGFQFGALGHRTAATKDFQRALSVEPADLLTRRLMPVLGEKPASLPPVIEAPVPPREELPPPDALEEIQARLSLSTGSKQEFSSPELNGPSE